jgi:hypothetical protein
VTDLKDQLMQLFADEPSAPNDLERIVTAGRRARRRRNVAVATAGTVGAAGLTAAVVVPVLASAGHGDTVQLGTRPPSPMPTSTPSAAAGRCYLISAPPEEAKQTLARLQRSGKVGAKSSVKQIHRQSDGRTVLEVCPQGTAPVDATPKPTEGTEQPAGPPYQYTEKPEAIASRLGAHLHDRVTGTGLTISYTRPFAQETTQLESGHPSYYAGNVDVREADGYGDIGVQVTHETTELMPFDGDCTAASNCEETKLPDGSVLRTGQVSAGRGLTVLTAEVHRPDGVVVQAQESNYPFGPDAGTQPHGDQPLSVKKLVTLAEDPDFTF